MAIFYIGIVDKGGEGWGVTFPDLPGCTSGGGTMAELFDMAVEAVRLWADATLIDSVGLPRARTLDDLLADPEVQETIAEVGPVSFIQVPLLRDTGRTVRPSVSMDAGLVEAIDAAAKRLGATRSSFLASAAREKIARGA